MWRVIDYFNKKKENRIKLKRLLGELTADTIDDKTIIESKNHLGFFIYPDMLFNDSGQYVTLLSHRPIKDKMVSTESGFEMSYGLELGNIYLHITTDLSGVSHFERIGIKGTIKDLPTILKKYSVHANTFIAYNDEFIKVIKENDTEVAKVAMNSILSALADINVKETKSKEINTVKSIGDLTNSISEDLLLKMCNKDSLNLDRLSISIGLALRDIKILMDEHGISEEDIISAVDRRKIRK